MSRRRAALDPTRCRDVGSTLIELLIAIVIIGTVVTGTLATLRTTIISGTINRDHATAHGWLQSASDLVYSAPKVLCDGALPDDGEAAARNSYSAVIAVVPNPEGWADTQIRIVPPIQFWNAANIDSDPNIEYFFSGTCDPTHSLQLINLEVVSESGSIIENVEIVK